MLAGYTALLLVALLSPSSGTQSGIMAWLSELLSDIGVPESLVAYGRLEVMMNVAIITPVTLIGTMLRPSLSWQDWTAYGFVASLTIELVQATLLPGRNGAFDDVVANTLGALLGALLSVLFGRSLHSSFHDKSARQRLTSQNRSGM